MKLYSILGKIFSLVFAAIASGFLAIEKIISVKHSNDIKK
jgi:hypothetical protein